MELEELQKAYEDMQKDFEETKEKLKVQEESTQKVIDEQKEKITKLEKDNHNLNVEINIIKMKGTKNDIDHNLLKGFGKYKD